MKTIAQQLNIKDFPFTINDSNGNRIYYEDSDGHWTKREFDSNGNEIYYDNSNGLWYKREYDSKGNQIYYEDSDGFIRDNRNIPEYAMEELVEKIGNFKLIKNIIMTNEKFELAKELVDKIKKLESFLYYYKDNRYKMSIHLDNEDSDCYHSEVFRFKEDDATFSELIEKQLNSKLNEMQKRFDEL